jgi:2-methylcitrate dehydratase
VSARRYVSNITADISTNPMTDAEMEEKFRLMAQKHLPADRVDNLLRIVWSVEKEQQVSNLIAATRV